MSFAESRAPLKGAYCSRCYVRILHCYTCLVCSHVLCQTCAYVHHCSPFHCRDCSDKFAGLTEDYDWYGVLTDDRDWYGLLPATVLRRQLYEDDFEWHGMPWKISDLVDDDFSALRRALYMDDDGLLEEEMIWQLLSLDEYNEA